MEPDITETEGAAQSSGFTEQGHIIVTDEFEAVLFPSGLIIAQGDNIVRLDPRSALAIAGASFLAFSDEPATETPETPSE